MIASAKVNSTFNKYSKVRTQRGMTGFDAARRVLDANGLQHVMIERVSGNLTDHYDPTANVIRLSDSVYGNASCAAIGVAAHEAGHAIQYSVGYAPIKFRAAIIPITNIGSKLAMPLIIIGILLSGMGRIFVSLAYLGVILFSLTVIFQLATLPTEFNASNRALTAIESYGMLSEDELSGAKKTLSAAAMTYVAALAVSVTQLLRFIVLIRGRGGRND